MGLIDTNLNCGSILCPPPYGSGQVTDVTNDDALFGFRRCLFWILVILFVRFLGRRVRVDMLGKRELMVNAVAGGEGRKVIFPCKAEGSC